MKTIALIVLFMAFALSCDRHSEDKQHNTAEEKTGTIEVTTFSINEGVDREEFIRSARSVERDFLEKQPGFLKRTLSMSSDSIWTDIVYWKDEKSAKQAMLLSQKSEQVIPFFEKINVGSITMRISTPILEQE